MVGDAQARKAFPQQLSRFSRWYGMPPGEFVERQMRLGIAEFETDDDVLTAGLSPQPVGRPFLRLRSAQAFDPDKIPLRHASTFRTGPSAADLRYRQFRCWYGPFQAGRASKARPVRPNIARGPTRG